MTLLRSLALLFTSLVLLGTTGCGTGSQPPSAGTQRVESRDGSFSVAVPADWASRPAALAQGGQNGQLAVQAPDPALQLLASAFPTTDGAEQHAVRLATGFAGTGMRCERREGFTEFGGDRLVLDCAAAKGGRTIRSVLIPMPHDGRSVLVLAQLWGDTLAATAPSLAPILGSWTWA